MFQKNKIGLGSAPEKTNTDTEHKDSNTPNDPSRGAQATHSHIAPNTAPPIKPFSKEGTHMPNKPTTPTTAPKNFRTSIPRQNLDIPTSQHRAQPIADTIPNDKKLVVGREIKLSGAISACECLIVEGEVTAELAEACDVIVCKGGMFKGTATVERAEVSGIFEGDLTATDTAVIKAGGVVKGNITYVNIIMEKGSIVEGTLKPTKRQAPPMKAKLADPVSR